MKEWPADLDPDRCWQVHRGTIVNVDAVAGVLREDAEKQFLLLKGRTERLSISRPFFDLFGRMQRRSRIGGAMASQVTWWSL